MSGKTTSRDSIVSPGHRRLYELIDSALLEFGSLEPRKKAILALTRELKVDKDQLRAMVSKAKASHPQIHAIARVHKLVQDAKASGKQPDLKMFRRLQPAAKSAGKDDAWLGQQLGYMPQYLTEANQKKQRKSSGKALVLAVFFTLLAVGVLVWWFTYGALMYKTYQKNTIDEAFWHESLGLNTYNAYQSYLRNHPNGFFANDARARLSELDEAAWKEASLLNTREAYQQYIKQYRIYEIQASSRLDKLLTGDSFRDCLACPEMLVVPAGEFLMGSDSGDDDELPVHRVKIARPFAVGKFEVTFSEWDLCALKGGCARDIYDSTYGRELRPVINVSWEDAHEYINWVSGASGHKYRLLTEAEWEYAARGGSNTEFWWGNNLIADKAVCIGCVSNWSNESTATVGQYGANGYGLYDMAGNVAEWVEDCKHDDYSGAPVTGQSWGPELDGDCGMAVVRGGSWLSYPVGLRSADRAYAQRSYSDHGTGFRVARDLN